MAWQGELAYPVTITLDPDQALPAATQLTGDVVLPGEVHDDVPWVPPNALTTIGTQSYLDVLQASGIERVPVEVGLSNGQQVEIVSGVRVGDTIVFP